MSDQEYFAHPYLNASTLKMFSGPESKFSKRQALHKLQTPRAPSPAMALGTLFHAGMEHGYVDAKPAKFNEFRTKEAKAWKAEQLEKGLPIISQKDIDTAKMMCESVKLTAPDIWDMARSSFGIREREVYNGGLKLKCKEDLFLDGVLYDWKSTKGITPYEIRRACDFFCYDLQAAHYLLTDTEAEDFVFIFVQSEPPFEVVIVPSKPILDRGRRKWETAYRRYSERMEDVLEAVTVDPSWEAPELTEEEDVEL